MLKCILRCLNTLVESHCYFLKNSFSFSFSLILHIQKGKVVKNPFPSVHIHNAETKGTQHKPMAKLSLFRTKSTDGISSITVNKQIEDFPFCRKLCCSYYYQLHKIFTISCILKVIKFVYNTKNSLYILSANHAFTVRCL